jgi:hypothetical protein
MFKSVTAVAVGLIAFSVFSLRGYAQSSNRDEVLKQIEAKHQELQQLEKQFLAPSPEDLEAYAEFLAQPDTGLTRLLPREIYDSSDHPEKRMTIHGGGSYFSFTRLTHEYGWSTQIGLERDEFNVSFAGADYGMIANLGDIPLGAVNLQNATVKFLDAHQVALEEPKARSEYRRYAEGVVNEGTLYKTRQPVKVDNSYVLRCIEYSDADVLVGFRVVRRDSDGSVVIVWKLLRKYPKPEFVRND